MRLGNCIATHDIGSGIGSSMGRCCYSYARQGLPWIGPHLSFSL